MIRVKTCFAARGVVIDARTNEVSAFGLIERVDPAPLPFLMPSLCFFCLWEREPVDPVRCRATFDASLNGHELARTAVDIDFEQHPRSRAVVRIDNCPLGELGPLVLRMAIPGHATAEWRIAVGDPRHDATLAGAGGSYESVSVSIAAGQVNLHRR